MVTQNGGPSESLHDGGIEYVSWSIRGHPRDCSGLLRLLRDQGTWEAFARRGRQRVLDRYTWERTASGYLREIEAMVADPGGRRSGTLLPIHPYFRDPTPENDVTLDELRAIYFGGPT